LISRYQNAGNNNSVRTNNERLDKRQRIFGTTLNMMNQDYILNRSEMNVRVREELLPTALFINLYLLSARLTHIEL
jgi:hypothetical protein